MNRAKQHTLAPAKGFTKDIHKIKISYPVLSTFLEDLPAADELGETFAGIV